ncbi:MAG: hypothetical protein RB289_12445 [Paludibacter sp.]|nr:hypothetical protein [Paludibacter sp.]
MKNKKTKTVVHKPMVSEANPKTIYYFLLRIILFSFAIIAIVVLTDKRGYFNPDYSNDHTRRKWNTYYEFVKKQPVDIVLVGNSHLYTGLNPDNLSNTLGANCFILASPGTTLTDSYFCLKEAIAVNKPKIAIVETFTINDYDNHKIKDGTLSDQFKSFSARKNIVQKMLSTPLLFTSDNYVAAWSNTIRNHNFIFTDTAQIKRNLTYKEPVRHGLYLGRYNRFMSGIEDSTLLKYNKPGFVAYDYSKNMASPEAKRYIQKIIDLCRKNNVKLVFMTLPMYHRHVHNYEVYKEDLKKIIGDQHWIDFQQPYDTAAFTAECFENTIAGNQHMTYYGARVAAYKLAGYLKVNFGKTIPNRSSNIEWKRLFYASDGYFENYPPENDGVSQLLVQNTTLPNGLIVREMSLVPNGQAKQLIIKIDKESANSMYGKSIKVLAQSSIGGQNATVELPVKCTLAYAPDSFYVFISEPLNPALTIQRISAMDL